MSAIGMTKTLLLTQLVAALRHESVPVPAETGKSWPHVAAWVNEVATALIEAERGDPPQTRGLRKDIAVEVSQDRITNPPRLARTNLGRRESDR